MGIPVTNMDYLQGDNEMRTFAAMTGGRAYFPRFEGELPELSATFPTTFATNTRSPIPRRTRSSMEPIAS